MSNLRDDHWQFERVKVSKGGVPEIQRVWGQPQGRWSHCECGEGLWLQGKAASQTHSFREAEPQVIPPNAKQIMECFKICSYQHCESGEGLWLQG